jgi:hypothetical protein
MKKDEKKIKKIQEAKEITQKFEFFSDLYFNLKSDRYFFYLSSDYPLLPEQMYKDFKENDIVRDLLISIMQWHEVPLVFHATEDYGDDLDLYLFYAIILEYDDGQIKENKLQYNCYIENSKLDLFVKILFFLSKLDEIYKALDDYGLLEEYLIV